MMGWDARLASFSCNRHTFELAIVSKDTFHCSDKVVSIVQGRKHGKRISSVKTDVGSR